MARKYISKKERTEFVFSEAFQSKLACNEGKNELQMILGKANKEARRKEINK